MPIPSIFGRPLTWCAGEGINGLLAVGGGSVIDSAKAVAAGSGFDGDILELYTDPQAQPSGFLPIGAVVTIPATASESNEMSVISDSVSGRKIGRPFHRQSRSSPLLNPALTLSVSSYQNSLRRLPISSPTPLSGTST